MGQLMDGDRGARWPGGRVKIAVIDLVEAAEIIHADQIDVNCFRLNFCYLRDRLDPVVYIRF